VKVHLDFIDGIDRCRRTVARGHLRTILVKIDHNDLGGRIELGSEVPQGLVRKLLHYIESSQAQIAA
jgi:hypothetical protein